MAAPASSPLVAALALTLVVLVLPCIEHAHADKPGSRDGRGSRFMEWVSHELPVIALKSVECIKKNQRDVSTAMLSLFTDIGKCFDDAKGSILLTVECLLKNSQARMINTVTIVHKVVNCLGYSKNGRLCVSVTNVNDEQCPFLVGV